MLGVENLTRRIREVKEEVDFLVVMFNSGTEDTHDPSPRSIKALRAAAEAGADLVIGNQAHHVQAAEVHEGVFVAYALGNFIYDQVHTPEHSQCYLVEASLWADRVATTRLLPCEIELQYRPLFAGGETRAKILGDIFGAAERLPVAE
jgi:poly-gamma-glutamate synthesis protein (capsule biosynthesis protein)